MEEKKDIMKTLRKRSGKKKVVVSSVAGVLVILLAGVFMLNRNKQKEVLTEQASSIQHTDVVSTRSLVKSIGAVGTIVGTDSKSISVNLSGTDIEAIHVAIGDTVEKGELLVTFDKTDIEENLKSAKEALSKQQSQNTISKENAERNVSDAERNYEKQLKAAQDSIDNSTYVQVADALYNFDTYFGNLTDGEKQAKKAELEAKLEAAEAAYESALENYENVRATQESSLASAKNTQKSTVLGLTTSTQEAQVENYQKQLESADVYAPISGIVTALNYEAGDTYSGGVIVTIQDCSSFEIEASISEYDISDIIIGQKVVIKTNATGDEEMEGTVTFISPTAINSSAGMGNGDVNYKVKISIANPDERLRLDMSASLSIIIEEHDNVMTVPYNAVQTKENGTTFVMVREDNGLREVDIEVVMESNYYTEIKSNELKEGMEVLVIESEGTSIMDMFGQGGVF